MSSDAPEIDGPVPSAPNVNGPNRQGSVKRAREQLQAGARPTRASPPVPAPRPQLRPPPPSKLGDTPTAKELAHRTQWPLPDGGLPIYLEAEESHEPEPQQPQLLAPRAPPPSRPPRPSEVPAAIPSPSVYSVVSGEGSETQSVFPTLPARAFTVPKPLFAPSDDVRRPSPPSSKDGSSSPTSTLDLNPRISIATEDLFHRQSTASGLSSLPDVPPYPLPEPIRPQDKARPRAGGLAPPAQVPKSAVSTISEELSSSRQTFISVASSRAIPSSWGPGTPGSPGSETMGIYLDDMSDVDDHDHSHNDDNALLVRNASLGKRGKPTVRTISRLGAASDDNIPNLPSTNPQEGYHHKPSAAAGALAGGVAANQTLNVVRRVSISTASGESFVDPEKPRFAQQPVSSTEDLALEKEIAVLPKAAPTMSDTRPHGKKPPRLNLGAVRDAETRGSLSSLSDLIRRATKLATNLDRGKTASRSDLVEKEAAIFRHGLGETEHRRGSGSISDILTSFPRPGAQTPESHSSWPVFFGRSGLRNVEALPSNDEPPQTKEPPRRRCAMSRKWVLILCTILFIVLVLAILLPVFLIAVPKQMSSGSGSSNGTDACASSNPCQNGGISVSSGEQCSCVCSNGFTGSQCTISGGSSCSTAEVMNAAMHMNATMGNQLSDVFQASSTFNVTLDSVTIMALFSMNNASCETENSLVKFNVPSASSNSSSSSNSKARRVVSLPLERSETADVDQKINASSLDTLESSPTQAQRSVATSNGILFDNTATPTGATATSTLPSTTATAMAASTGSAGSDTASNNTSKAVPQRVIQFSQVAVLYILEKTGSLTSAIWSEGQIETYLTQSYPKASHPQLDLLGKYDLDFEKMTITTQ
ncbi:Uncharacterized protein PECH_007579 [Penicillium ucsense]|uniref:EGF-like domain-containing protein n=1 Tax=Penicillium ucsense TaxID=2839758 RepID=A0A8J8W5K7_9EURO|nr:Uncharacterized protein PECM_004474 [Penicillium ucsense]KAF7738874.1 Uncharacterized protein PECH_007579 [Penicillium ucsense]